ncbi:MAG: aspartate--tRNA ligase [Clostridiales bacterium]|nr:aspartate--tRNA ligase [Clostridiales bacterium]
MYRTGYCGNFRKEHIGRQATVCGWVQTRRDMGGVIFVDVHDREGTLQTVLDKSVVDMESFALAERLHNQTVVQIAGVIRHRNEETYNPMLPTGEVELAAERLTILSEADTLPFPIEDSETVREELRLKYRYLDLRRPHMLGNLQFRAKLQREAEGILAEDGFLNVDTPILCKSTPEGARDYLVPSRIHPGTFYALPQSPQIYKQLLMVSGIDKYYQIARCFRDEDLRADRQPEFTQVDFERSFVHQEDMLDYLESLFTRLYERATERKLELPFKRLTWTEAMDVYGNDKPDLRFGLPIVDVSEIAAQSTFTVFNTALKNGGIVRAVNVKGAGRVFTRTTIEQLTKFAISNGAKGMAWVLYKEDGEINSILPKYFTEDVWKRLEQATDLKPGDFLLFCADEPDIVRKTLSALRVRCAELMDLIDKHAFQFALVTDFPMFEYKKDEKRFAAMHHPFTMPFLEDVELMADDATKAQVRSQAYDVVLNGVELGSGSVRIHRHDIQALVFDALGFSKEEAKERFGFMMGAFRFGTPPHAGFAFGLDRLCMLLVGANSVREVIAFPKTKDASCLMTGAPDFVDPRQLAELRLGVDAADALREEHIMQLTKKTVQNTAMLSMLSLSASDEQALDKDFIGIVEFAGELETLEKKAPPVPYDPTQRSVNVRPDKAGDSFTVSEVLMNAKTKLGNCIIVPRTFE